MPERLLNTLGVGPGDQLEIEERPDGFVLRPGRIVYTRLGTLCDRIQRGRETFDLQDFRKQMCDPSLRD